jgi:hypothetical protein
MLSNSSVYSGKFRPRPLPSNQFGAVESLKNLQTNKHNISEVHADRANCCVMYLSVLLTVATALSSVYKMHFITADCRRPLTGPQENTAPISAVD